jgi:hypothetical protein
LTDQKKSGSLGIAVLISDMIHLALSDTDIRGHMIDTRLLSRIQNMKSLLDSLRPLPEQAVTRLKEQILFPTIEIGVE